MNEDNLNIIEATQRRKNVVKRANEELNDEKNRRKEINMKFDTYI